MARASSRRWSDAAVIRGRSAVGRFMAQQHTEIVALDMRDRHLQARIAEDGRQINHKLPKFRQEGGSDDMAENEHRPQIRLETSRLPRATADP